MITIRFLACLQKISMFFFAVIGLCLLVCQFYGSRIDCQTADQSTKAEIEYRCLKSDYYNPKESKVIDAYNADYAHLAWEVLFTAFIYSFLWRLWKHWRPAGLNSDYLQDSITKSGFTFFTTMAYLLLFYFEIQSPFCASSLSMDRLGDYPVLRVSCQIQKNGWLPPYLSATCKLPLNLAFKLAHLTIRCWHVMLTIFLFIAYMRYALYYMSSGQRVSRLSTLLKNLDERRINELAKDVNTFFKIDSYADEIELKHSKRLKAF